MSKKKKIQQEVQEYSNTPEVMRSDSALIFIGAAKRKKLNSILNWSDGSFGL